MNKPVLLIGSSGFIGTSLVQGLEDRYRIYQINRHVDHSTSAGLDLAADLLDTKSSEQISEWSNGKEFSAILYLTNINKRNLSPDLTMEEANLLALDNFLSNFTGTAEAFGFFSSVYVYKNPAYGFPINENSPIDPSSVYGRFKVDMEQRVINWCKTRKIPLSNFRPEWVYGETEKTQKLIPQLCHAAASTEIHSVTINPEETRQPIYVGDIVNATGSWLNISHRLPVETFLLVGPKSIRQSDLVEIARSRASIPGNPRVNLVENSSASLHYSFDNSGTRARLNWQPEITPEMGLSKVIDFLKSVKDN